MSRVLSIYRNTHANKSMGNILKDTAKVTVTVDGGQKYILVPEEWVQITLDDGEHTLRVAEGFSRGLNYWIPAGKEDYRGWYFHGEAVYDLSMVPSPDPFGDQLVDVVLDMFRNGNLKELLTNRYNTTEFLRVAPHPEHLTIVYYDSRKMLSNICSEEIPYRNLGLKFPQVVCGGYLGGLQRRIGEAVDDEKGLGVCYTGSGYKVR